MSEFRFAVRFIDQNGHGIPGMRSYVCYTREGTNEEIWTSFDQTSNENGENQKILEFDIRAKEFRILSDSDFQNWKEGQSFVKAKGYGGWYMEMYAEQTMTATFRFQDTDGDGGSDDCNFSQQVR